MQADTHNEIVDASLLTTRLLPQSEWDKLGDTDIPVILPFTRPEDIQIVVVEEQDRIVGAWAVLRVVHLEGAWVTPEYRGNGVVRARLMQAGLEAAQQWAGDWAMTAAKPDDEHVKHIITKHMGGIQVPMYSYVVPLRGH